MEIHTPKLIAAASESGADVFEVKYFLTARRTWRRARSSGQADGDGFRL